MNSLERLAVLVVALNFALIGGFVASSRVERNNIEYHPGVGLNLILTVPHGGRRMPSTIPDRKFGCWDDENSQCEWRHGCQQYLRCRAITVSDWNTVRLAMEIRNNTCALFRGSCPAVVINLLSRKKFDANRNLSEATFEERESVDAFETFHEFIDEEKAKIDTRLGGLLLDIHGHGHIIQRAELGYLLKRLDLEGDLRISLPKSSIRHLARKFHNDTEKLSALLRGDKSLGHFIEEEGFASVPSMTYPSPGNDPYFSGKYNVERHGSRDGGSVDAVQIESCGSVRDDETVSNYACGVSLAIKKFLCTHYYNLYCPNTSVDDNIRRSCQSNSSRDDCVH